MSKAAELNGVPGPAHLLEMKDEIPLDAMQVSTITQIFEQMRKQAIRQGLKLIALDLKLESHFQNRTITDAILRSSLDAIAKNIAAKPKLKKIPPILLIPDDASMAASAAGAGSGALVTATTMPVDNTNPIRPINSRGTP